MNCCTLLLMTLLIGPGGGRFQNTMELLTMQQLMRLFWNKHRFSMHLHTPSITPHQLWPLPSVGPVIVGQTPNHRPTLMQIEVLTWTWMWRRQRWFLASPTSSDFQFAVTQRRIYFWRLTWCCRHQGAVWIRSQPLYLHTRVSQKEAFSLHFRVMWCRVL